jgi:hypothetical protein
VVTVNSASASLNIGRRTRSIPPAIRRVLLLRDRGRAFPGCTHDRFLHGHHVQHWLHGGETSADNLRPDYDVAVAGYCEYRLPEASGFVSKAIARRLHKFTILILHRNGISVMIQSV